MLALISERPINVAWLWLIPALPVLFLVLLFLLRGRRLAFISLVSLLAFLLLATLSIRNWNTEEGGNLEYWVSHPDGLDTTDFGVEFRSTAIYLWFRTGHTGPDDAIPTDTVRRATIHYYHSPANPPTDFYEPFLNFGFIAGVHDFQGAKPIIWLDSWRFYTQLWFPLLLLSITPSLWFYNKYKRHRTAHALFKPCPDCGYSLLAHAPGQNCPECGTPITESKSKIKN